LNRKVSVQLARKPETAQEKADAATSGAEGSGNENRRKTSGRGRGRGGRGGRGGRAARGGRVSCSTSSIPTLANE
jgi:hypothetical protein